MIAAALSVQDPRERPQERAGGRRPAAHAHSPTRSPTSSPMLKLWNFFDEALEHKKSNRKLAQLCRENFLSVARMREWRDVHGQLHDAGRRARLEGTPARMPASRRRRIHRALLAGLLGNVGLQRRGARQLPRRARHQVLDPPGLAGQEGRQVDRRRRDDRDDAPVRALRRRHRAGLAGGSGRAPDQAPPRATRTGKRSARRSWRSSAARSTACRCTPSGACTTGRWTRGCARDLHPPGAGGGRVRHAGAVLRAQPEPDRATSRGSSTSRAGPTCWSTTS